jgi:hypothetical protein
MPRFRRHVQIGPARGDGQDRQRLAEATARFFSAAVVNVAASLCPTAGLRAACRDQQPADATIVAGAGYVASRADLDSSKSVLALLYGPAVNRARDSAGRHDMLAAALRAIAPWMELRAAPSSTISAMAHETRWLVARAEALFTSDPVEIVRLAALAHGRRAGCALPQPSTAGAAATVSCSTPSVLFVCADASAAAAAAAATSSMPAGQKKTAPATARLPATRSGSAAVAGTGPIARRGTTVLGGV